MSRPTRLLTVYPAMDGHRWRLKAGGRIVAESGEAYRRRADAVTAARKVFTSEQPITLVYDVGTMHNPQHIREQIR